ncbi:hypothetical protein [Pseudoalteromonas rubra]|uniref:hypothetical protein n=1 Tax=Pseudoalteromonas rubra TaxID=43658 RepID=UPI000F7B59DA|nr:hypothetical protein [Pseudoalteromonas rubra]
MQEPASEFYTSIEVGVVSDNYGLSRGDQVVKGQALLSYVINGENRKTIFSKTEGQVEYISSAVFNQRQFSSGEILMKVKSSSVQGWLHFDRFIPKDIAPQSQLWICQGGSRWQLKVDYVHADTVFISLALNLSDFHDLDALSKQASVPLFLKVDACL